MLVRFERVPMARPVWRNVADFERDVDSLFSGFFSAGANCVQAPALNFAEKQNESVVSVELPGVAKDDVKITLEDDLLTIKGERKPSALPEGAQWIRNERRSGEFFRTIQLPHPVKADAISAELANGILYVTLPKAEEARPREIAVK
jgi:HSP20 family protein